MAATPAIVGGGEGVYEMQQSGSSGGGVCDDQSRRTATEWNGKIGAPGALVKTTWSRVASVEVKGSQDLVEKIVEIERSRNPKG